MRLSIITAIGLVLISGLHARSGPAAEGSEPVEAGDRDFYFGTSVSAPTGEKPESKLWFHDGLWWGSLWNDAVAAYHIYRLDLASQSWVDTGTPPDDRSGSKADGRSGQRPQHR